MNSGGADRDRRLTIAKPPADRTEIERAVSHLFSPGVVVEVRIPRTRVGVIAGYFDDLRRLADALYEADSKYRPTGIYYVLNSVNSALLARAYNRLKEHAEYTTADTHIIR